ncbi:MAG: TonB-dependent receptor [Candidatus Azobacteroides sp.]|nr:TonB-dependent receptor [Candidatus Azobacteroides sp.]
MCVHPIIKADVTQEQKITVTGIVSDKNEPIIGASVSLKGTSAGTVTDREGKYSITVPNKDATLVFTYVGYTTQELVVGNQTNIDVVLTETAQDINEVVVVGYGVQKKVNVIGAVTTLQGEAIKNIPAASAAASVAGRLPGVTVIQTGGEPGTDGYMSPQMYIRGRTTLGSDAAKTNPLVIIDGVQGRSIGEIDPNDIASFSVLKDASAAIYGAQAANGVILITTKNGEAGKPKLDFSFYEGIMTPSKIPDMCNAAEYATMISEYEDNTGAARTYTDDDIALFASGADPWEHPNTDWYGDLIKNWTASSRYNLNITGGTKRGTTYYVSLGYKLDDAMYKQSSTKYNQINVRTKLSIPITNWLNADINLAGFKTHKLYPYRSAADIITAATRSLPTLPDYWPTGEPAPDIENGDNPVVTSSFAGGKNEQDTYRLQSNMKATIAPPFINGLSLSAGVDYDLNNFYRKRFFQPWYLYFSDKANAVRDPNTGYITSMPLIPQLRQPTGAILPSLQNDYNRTINTTDRIELNYARTFGDHDITLYAGFEQYTSNYNEFWAQRENYLSTLIQTLNAGPDLNKDNSGYETIYARKSWIGRATYAYKGKYLAEALIRRDGSLKFPPNSRWGNFPGFMLGWRASEENFWKNSLPFINYFKMKASYGEMGMDPGDPFQYIDKYSLGTIVGMVFGTNGVIETTTGPPTVANHNITWERQKTKNVGLESQFLKGLLFLNFDYFYNIRDHILAPRNASVPDFSGITLPDENIARVNNHGIEIEGGIRKVINKNFSFDLSGNFSFSRNRVAFQDEPARPVPWQVTTGHPYGATLMYEAIGIYKDQAEIDATPHPAGAQPGDVIFKDVSGDGQITADDRILVDYTAAPETFYGITLNTRWKDFSLSVLLQGQGKYLKKNYADVRRGIEGNYFQFMYDGRWISGADNLNVTMPRAWDRSTYFIMNDNTLWYDNTAYLRLKDVVLSYSIPARYYKSIGVSNISVYCSGNNLAYLWSATNKFDPESANADGYPTMKTFAFGANISF